MQALRYSLASVWLLTALASLAWPQEESLALLARTGLAGHAALAALYAGITADLLMGILTLLKPSHWQRWLWPAQAAVILTYSVIILIQLPEIALHPFGMLIKNIPILTILWILWRNATKEKTHAV